MESVTNNHQVNVEELSNKKDLVTPQNNLQDKQQNILAYSKNNHRFLKICIIILLFLLSIGAIVMFKYLNMSNAKIVSNNNQNHITNNIQITPLPTMLIKENPHGQIIKTVDDSTEFFFPEGSFDPKAQPPVQLEALTIMSYSPPKGKIIGGLGGEIKLLQGPFGLPPKPFTITIHFENDNFYHVNKSTMSIYYGDPTQEVNPAYTEELKTNIDLKNNIATAEATKFGVYQLLGDLICPEDKRENDDDQYAIHGSQDIKFNIPSHDLFDIKEDVDWYFIEMKDNKKYTVSTMNLGKGVAPIIELSDDGVNIRQDNNSDQPKEIVIDQKLFNGYAQIKLSPQKGSKTGCDATYDLLVREE
jgi:hypothetical protein